MRRRSVDEDESSIIGVVYRQMSELAVEMSQPIGDAVSQTIDDALSQAVGDAVSQTIDDAVSRAVGDAVRQPIDDAESQTIDEAVSQGVGDAMSEQRLRFAPIRRKKSDLTKNVKNESNGHVRNESNGHVKNESNVLVKNESNGHVKNESNGIVVKNEPNGRVKNESNNHVKNESNGLVVKNEPNGLVKNESNGHVKSESNDPIPTVENKVQGDLNGDIGRRGNDAAKAATNGTAVIRSNGILDAESKAPLVVAKGDKPIVINVAKGGLTKAEEKRARGSCLRQVIAAFVANLGTINTGLAFGFSAVAIPQLQDENSTIPIDDSQASWIASLSSVTTPFGCILGGYLMDMIGRKYTLMVTEIPLILGWLLISCSSNVGMIYGGRLLVGLGSGMVGAPARVYTGEVTQPHLRGMLSALAAVGVSLGVLIEYFLGAVVTWPVMAGISAAIPMLALITITMMPETPNYLLNRGKPEEARSALKRFRGDTCDVDRELDTLVCFATKNNVKRLTGPKEMLRALAKPSALKPFAILVTYFMIYQFSGVNSVTFYAVEVFKDSGAEIDKYLATVILGVVRLLSTIVACISLRRCGRRPLTLISSIGCGVSMIGLGTYMYLREGWRVADVAPVATWFPVACIFAFTIACTLGFLVVPWVMIGEVYPTQIRGLVGGMTTCAAHMFVFIVVKTYPYLQHVASKHGTFWIYGCISLVGTIFFYTCLPETKGKTLQEIEDYFSGRTSTLKSPKTPKNNKPQILEAGKGEALP